MRATIMLLVGFACGGGGNGDDASVGTCATTCAGCCNGSTCETGTTDTACGAHGAACAPCTNGSCSAGGACVAPPMIGVDWRQVTGTGAFGARFGFGLGVHAGQMWIIGGSSIQTGALHDVWHSSDGITWTASTGNGGFPASGPRCVVSFGGSLWIIPGDQSVWSSPDGAAWTKQLAALPFSGATATCAVWNNQIWLAGGSGGRQVWSSSNGTTWTMAIADYGGSDANGYEQMAVLGSTLYIIDTDDFVTSGVYASTNGTTWLPSTLAAPGGFLAVADGALWTMFGGTGSIVSTSADGAAWTKLLTTTPFGPRSQFGFTAFDATGSGHASLWVIGGQNTSNQIYVPDVWASP